MFIFRVTGQTTKPRLCFILNVGFSTKNFILDQRKRFKLTTTCFLELVGIFENKCNSN